MSDLISRQALMKEFADFVRRSNNSDFAKTPTWNDAVSLVGSMPSAQPETLTDKEQRIFLSAMGREEKVCKQVDDDWRDERQPGEKNLVCVCHENHKKGKRCAMDLISRQAAIDGGMTNDSVTTW